MVAQAFQIAPDKLQLMNFWINEWSRMWKSEPPLRIHSREIDAGGAPEWHPEFSRYIERGAEEGGKTRYGRPLPRPRNPDQRLRTTRAFRKLRKANVREYEVLYQACVQRHTLEETTEWLNQRAARNGLADRYSHSDVQILLLSAVDKVLRHW